MKMLPTVDELIEKYGDDVHAADAYVKREFVPPAVQKPRKPLPNNLVSAQDHINFANKLEEYEKAMAEWSEEDKKRRKLWDDIYSLLKEFAEKVSDLDTVPKQYRAKVMGIAWDLGHSDGVGSYHHWLQKLSQIFE